MFPQHVAMISNAFIQLPMNANSFIKEGKVFGSLLILVFFILSILYAKPKKQIYIRKLPAVDAITESVGRAAEMGRPVICSYGVARHGMDYWTVSGLAILNHTAEQCAELGVDIYVPLSAEAKSLVTHPIVKEMVRTAYTKAGTPEAFKIDNLRETGSSLVSWATTYAQMIYEVNPAANIFTGYTTHGVFLAEQAASLPGCVSIGSSFYLSATAMIAISCDYALIAQDLVAAGAYLSKDPETAGFLRTIDIISGFSILAILLGSILLSSGIDISTWLGV